MKKLTINLLNKIYKQYQKVPYIDIRMFLSQNKALGIIRVANGKSIFAELDCFLEEGIDDADGMGKDD